MTWRESTVEAASGPVGLEGGEMIHKRIPHDAEHPDEHPGLDVIVEFDEADEDPVVNLYQQKGFTPVAPGFDHIVLPSEHLLRVAQAVEEGA